MEENKTNAPEGKKLTLQELSDALAHVEQERNFYKNKANELYSQVQQLSLYNDFKLADYLFKVLDSPRFFSDGFVEKCASKLESFINAGIGDGMEEDENPEK